MAPTTRRTSRITPPPVPLKATKLKLSKKPGSVMPMTKTTHLNPHVKLHENQAQLVVPRAAGSSN
ncbi:MAG: hypothetical protein MMC33_009223, partial [Icmadophila ericetorum]|nr:hypothetical protein [Icmadophila ericetorum]